MIFNAKQVIQRFDEMTIEIQRNDKWIQVELNELTNLELCECLSNIQIDSDEFVSEREINEWYAVIDEAIRRLTND